MAIVNVTPDSFSDGGTAADLDAAVAKARRLVAEGARILDVGGESTRPGAEPVSLEEELRRVVPVVRRLRETFDVVVSVDTTKAGVFEEAYKAGASIVNDVSAFAADPEMAAAVAATDAAAILMHRRGDPATMGAFARYDDVVDDVANELAVAVDRAREKGVGDDRLAVDPGLGFAKTAEHSWRLVAEIERFDVRGLPIVVGPSRKSFLASAAGRAAPKDRDVATAVVVARLARAGVACVRVHDPASTADALKVEAALRAAESRA
jgi:dihydropteroate synthase